MQKQVEALGVKFAEESSRSIRQRPRRSTDQAATISTSRRDGFEQPIEARALVAAFGAGDAGVLKELDLRSGPRPADPPLMCLAQFESGNESNSLATILDKSGRSKRCLPTFCPQHARCRLERRSAA
jgi:hypothetical protein